METRTKNKDMWKFNVELRDNGTVTIGTVFCILAPRPVENLMKGDIPLIESKFPAMVMNTPRTFLPVEIDYQVTGNHCFAFCLKNVELSVAAFTPVSTKCSGCLCDKQRVDDHADSERGCGCYAMHHRRSNIAFQHDIEVSFDNGNCISMDVFSSTQFSKLYLSENVPPSILLQQLQMTWKCLKLKIKCRTLSISFTIRLASLLLSVGIRGVLYLIDLCCLIPILITRRPMETTTFQQIRLTMVI